MSYLTINIGQSATVKKYSYNLVGCDGNKNISFSKDGTPEPDWFNYRELPNNVIELSISANESGIARTGCINIGINGRFDCKSAITINQISCTCADIDENGIVFTYLSETELVSIPVTGYPAGTIIGHYSMSNVSCINTLVLKSSSDVLKLRCEDGDIILAVDVPSRQDESHDVEPLTFPISAYISSNMSVVCMELEVIQEGSVNCDCAHMTSSVSSGFDTRWPNEGTSPTADPTKKELIFSADTKGCGDFIPNTQSYMFWNYEDPENPIGELEVVKSEDGKKFYMYGGIRPNDGLARNTIITIAYKQNGKDEYDCVIEIEIRQSSEYIKCNCDLIENSMFYMKSTYKGGNSCYYATNYIPAILDYYDCPEKMGGDYVDVFEAQVKSQYASCYGIVYEITFDGDDEWITCEGNRCFVKNYEEEDGEGDYRCATISFSGTYKNEVCKLLKTDYICQRRNVSLTCDDIFSMESIFGVCNYPFTYSFYIDIDDLSYFRIPKILVPHGRLILEENAFFESVRECDNGEMISPNVERFYYEHQMERKYDWISSNDIDSGNVNAWNVLLSKKNGVTIHVGDIITVTFKLDLGGGNICDYGTVEIEVTGQEQHDCSCETLIMIETSYVIFYPTSLINCSSSISFNERHISGTINAPCLTFGRAYVSDSNGNELDPSPYDWFEFINVNTGDAKHPRYDIKLTNKPLDSEVGYVTIESLKSNGELCEKGTARIYYSPEVFCSVYKDTFKYDFPNYTVTTDSVGDKIEHVTLTLGVEVCIGRIKWCKDAEACFDPFENFESCVNTKFFTTQTEWLENRVERFTEGDCCGFEYYAKLLSITEAPQGIVSNLHLTDATQTTTWREIRVYYDF